MRANCASLTLAVESGINYGGSYAYFSSSDPDFTNNGWSNAPPVNINDKATSARIRPGCHAKLHEHINGGGNSYSLAGDATHLGTMDNKASSLTIQSC